MITIFTPTYNREETLPRLYESLKGQSSKNFEWIIVDDGSVDETEELVKSFIDENEFKIVYKKVENGGKMRAVNIGLSLATQEYFFIVDSDDFLDEHAVEMVEEEVTILPEDYAGVVFRKAQVNSAGEKFLVGNSMGEEQIDSNPLDIFYNKKIGGDKAEIVKTNIMRSYTFPEFAGEKFVPEGYVWNRIGERYTFRYIDEEIYYCEYLADGYTMNFQKILKKNPKGFKLYYRYMMTRRIPWENRLKFFVRYMQSIYFDIVKK